MIDPRDIAKTFTQIEDYVGALDEWSLCPQDIKDTWPNVRGFMRRIPGQAYHRPTDDPPTEPELETFAAALRIHLRRVAFVFSLFAQGARCGHLEGRDETECHWQEAADNGPSARVGACLTANEKQVWAYGYRYGFAERKRGSVLRNVYVNADLPETYLG